jgi:hypothetical protein
MSDIPKMKRLTEKKNLTLKIDEEIDQIYRVGRQNGWDVSEIARRAVTKELRRLEGELKRPAS